MTRRDHFVALVVACALAGMGVIVTAQQRPDRGHGQSGARVYDRLTGTYQLESARSEDPRRAVEQATRTLRVNQRQGANERLMNRLNAPDTITIDRNRNSVTIASSLGQRVTFEANGSVRTEQGYPGRSVATRATLNGDQLTVTTSGNRGNDFSVTFESIDGGRSLRVSRRIYDDDLRQPVTVRSVYRKSSDEARWDLVATDRSLPSRNNSPTRDFGVPDSTRLTATLDDPLSTRNAHAEDRFTLTTRSPSQFQGAVIEGSVTSVNASGRIKGRAEMTLAFDSIRMTDGRTVQFDGILEQIRMADGETIDVDKEGTAGADSQTGKTVQRGAIGAGIGAIIGAIGGGGTGAAIGAAIGAGGGVGTVLVQGRDQLDLPRGAELTILSGSTRLQSTSNSQQR